MSFSRRDTLALGFGGLAAAFVPGAALAATVEELTAAFADGAEIGEGDILLIAPEIAENGNAVSVEVEAPGALAIMLLATGNPEPAVATFRFGPAAANRRAATRIRLATTQDVVAVAQMEDGSVIRTQATVKVTIGGCGG